MQHSTKSVLNEKRQLFKKEAKTQKQKRDKTHKKHGKIYKTAQLNRKNAKKSLKKQISRLKTPDFAAISSKKQSQNPEKISGKKLYEVKTCKSGQKSSRICTKVPYKVAKWLNLYKKALKISRKLL